MDSTGRNDEYLDLAVDFAADVFKASLLIRILPEFMKPYVLTLSQDFTSYEFTYRFGTWLLTKTESNIKRAMNHIAPVLEERVRMDKENGGRDWAGRPVGYHTIGQCSR
jgi:hypothetical protein